VSLNKHFNETTGLDRPLSKRDWVVGNMSLWTILSRHKISFQSRPRGGLSQYVVQLIPNLHMFGREGLFVGNFCKERQCFRAAIVI